MKKIGRGYYYNVYDLGNGRVRKIPRSQIAQVWQLFVWTFLTPKTLVEEFIRAPYSEKNRKEQYDLSSQIAAADPALFGHPVFFGWEYEQDKATDLETLLPRVEPDVFLGYCKEYVKCIHGLWKKGMGEEVFNFMRNAGITLEGNMVLLDLNEYTFDKKRMIQMIGRRRYLRAFHTYKIPFGLRKKIRQLFDKEFSLDKFDELWGRERKLTLS